MPLPADASSPFNKDMMLARVEEASQRGHVFADESTPGKQEQEVEYRHPSPLSAP